MSGFLLGALGFVVLITVVVVVHELGHYVLAKLSGIRVDEFSVGFGPRLFSRRRGETVYSIRALPLGGFVRMPGMLGLEGEADAGERNFYRASIPKRMATILAGIVANFVLGAVCLAIFLAQPSSSYVVPGSPAAAAGMHDGDVILQLGAVTIDRSSSDSVLRSIRDATTASLGNRVDLRVQHPDGSIATSAIVPRLTVVYGSGCEREMIDVTSVDGKPVGAGDPAKVLAGNVTVKGTLESSYAPDRVGTTQTVPLSGVVDGYGDSSSGTQASWRIGYGAGQPGLSPGAAILAGIGKVGSFVGDTAQLLAQLLSQPACAQQFSGPVGIASVAGSSLQQGWTTFLFVIGEVSLSLGFVNVLPIPFLDGGRFLFVAIEAVRGRRIDPRHEAAAHAVGLALLILLFVFITISDLHNLSAGAGR